jgi:hypothetical protein
VPAYIAFVPIGELLVKQLILFCLYFLQPSPSGANGLRVIDCAAFICQALGNVLLQKFRVLHVEDELVVGIHICDDLLRDCGTPSCKLQSLRLCDSIYLNRGSGTLLLIDGSLNSWPASQSSVWAERHVAGLLRRTLFGTTAMRSALA